VGPGSMASPARRELAATAAARCQDMPARLPERVAERPFASPLGRVAASLQKRTSESLRVCGALWWLRRAALPPTSRRASYAQGYLPVHGERGHDVALEIARFSGGGQNRCVRRAEPFFAHLSFL
jgi:hypothetical protein